MAVKPPRIKHRARRLVSWMRDNVFTVALVSAAIGAVSVIGVASLAIYSSETFVQKTACSRDPSSAACAEIRQEVARAEPIKNPCISYQRVTATRGRNCKHFYVPSRDHGFASQDVHPGSSGAAAGSGPTATHTPRSGSSGGAVGPAPTHPGGHTGSGQPAPQEPSQPGGEATTESPAPTPAPVEAPSPAPAPEPEPEAVPPPTQQGLLESITGTLGDAVTQTGESTGQVLCSALHPCR